MGGVYYNEHDPKAAAWLRELIKQNLIAPGVVDERSIEDVTPSDLIGFKQVHFFAGIGVWSHALRQAGWPDDKEVWTGSCPCQPFSAAGKGAGVADERHLWPAFFWLIQKRKPSVVFGEQVASRDGIAWLDTVSADMEREGYAFGPMVLPACGFGSPHKRDRTFFVAHAARGRREQLNEEVGTISKPDEIGTSRDMADTMRTGRPERRSEPTNGFWRDADWLYCTDKRYRPVEPGTFPLAHGAPARMGRLRGYGNAIVAPVAIEFIKAAKESLPPSPRN
jgi:DNA (cytosine-5)-methyltransferase 1